MLVGTAMHLILNIYLPVLMHQSIIVQVMHNINFYHVIYEGDVDL